jgi:hypothetical protein
VSQLSSKQFLLVIMSTLGILTASKCASGDCADGVIGVEPSAGDTLVPAFVCRGQEQTFYTADTILTAITVWNQPRNYLDMLPRRLFVIGTLGGLPNQADIIYGPRDLVVTMADSINPVPYRYEFDPPILLPAVGTYAFVIMTDRELASFTVLADPRNPYEEGLDCEMGPVVGCVAPGTERCSTHPEFDLCFRAEFCRDIVIDVQRSSWGRLKLLYR